MDPHINPATGVWDDNYYANTGRFLSGNNDGGGLPTFDFDFEKAAKDAYGELGSYYNELLAKSQGDVNKALARLVEDYDTGVRYKAEDAAKANDQVDINQQIARKNIINNALARGLYQKTAFQAPDTTIPGGDYGIPDVNLAEDTALRTRQKADISTALTRFKETSGTNLARQKIDLPEKQKRYEADLEQQRRQEAAQLANLKGEQAYNKYNASLF